MMETGKTTYQLVRDVMKTIEQLTSDEEIQAEICNGIYLVISRAKLDVVEDAEKFIGNLRTFSLR